MITILLVIAHQGYQPTEYGITRKVLEDAGFKVVVTSNKSGIAHAMPTSPNPYDHATVDVQLVNARYEDYDGIFFVGGSGVLEALDTPAAHKLLQEAHAHNKCVGAICISPRILAHAGILTGKSATGWNDDKQLDDIFKEHNVTYVKQPVVVAGRIITADGPRAAEQFGKAIVKTLKK